MGLSEGKEAKINKLERNKSKSCVLNTRNSTRILKNEERVS